MKQDPTAVAKEWKGLYPPLRLEECSDTQYEITLLSNRSRCHSSPTQIGAGPDGLGTSSEPIILKVNFPIQCCQACNLLNSHTSVSPGCSSLVLWGAAPSYDGSNKPLAIASMISLLSSFHPPLEIRVPLGPNKHIAAKSVHSCSTAVLRCM